MATPILYYDPTSEPCRAVYWLCLEAGMPVQLEYVWLTRNEHVSERLLQVNPFHQVPALKCGAFCLSEATAIMQYLTDTAGLSERWFGGSIEQRARVNQRLSWYHTNLRKIMTLDYFLPALLMPAYLGFSKPEPARFKEMQAAVKEVLGKVELMLEAHPYLAGDDVTAVDLVYASELAALMIDPNWAQYLLSFPLINRWFSELSQRPGYRESHGAWKFIAPHITDVWLSQGSGDPSWVADQCEQFMQQNPSPNSVG